MENDWEGLRVVVGVGLKMEVVGTSMVKLIVDMSS